MKGPGQVARTSVRNINKPQLPEGCPSIEKNSTFADTIDMDFLTDPIFSDLGRSDFIGGIDNEALDFGHLEQFMQVAGSVSPTGGDTESTKAEPTSSQPSAPPTSESHHHIPSAAGRVGIGVASATTPIATPLAAGLSSHAHPHLPESPPDSGSEPPYSPLQDVHGLTLTSRDLGPPSGGDVYTGTGSGSVSGMQPHPHHLSPQFTPPHQQQHPHNHHHIQSSSHFQHSQPQHFLDTPHLAGPDLGPEVRIKHEAGLIINASSLGAVAPPHPGPVESHLEVGSGQHQTQYAGVQYEAEAAGLFDGGEFHNMAPAIGHPPVCMMSPDADASRVHVVGTSPPQTSRPSAPSTPTHRSSTRKRKMSAQLDCPEFPGLKGEPELSTSPSGGVAPGSYAFPAEAQKLGPTSPVSISLPAPMGEFATPALSTASLSPALSTVNSNQENSMDGSVAASGGSGDNSDSNALTPCIRFSPFQPQNWHKLCDQSLQELSVVYYRVDADKGFNFSVSDDAFVCQKKNHFQVTCHARLQGDAKFVRTPSGLEKIKAFHLHFYGVKLEAPNQTIRVEQSQSDRSKKPFYPVPIDLQSHIVSKITVGRLHFSETTNNNMRKKGRPNPEQRYFQLVVGLHVHTMSGNFPVISQGSERIIVRASNPGQFESDVDLCWQRGVTHDSIFHAGRVGINTDRPDESLVVHGNLKVSGHIVQPSDSRAKQEIGELDTSVQLRNLQKIRIVRYRYEPEFAIHSGLKRASDSDSEEIVDTGVIAQEVREVIPDAVQEGGSIVLPNGNVIENFLLVNKDRILMENIGAVKELCKVTGSLETRIDNLERMNNRLTRAKEYDQRSILDRERNATAKDPEVCSNRNLQIIIFLLVIVMAACLAAVSTLYFVEHNRQDHNHKHFERLQKPHHVAGGHHDPLLLSEQEQHYLQLRQFLHSNASKGGGLTWPPGLFGLTTSRPPPPPPPPVPAHPRNSSKSGQELTYNESGEFYSASGRTDELAVVMEKPVVSLQPLVTAPEPQTQVSTSAPPSRNNKTISNKGKVKWPLPQVVVRTTASLGTPPTASTPAASAPAAAPEAAPSKVGGAAHSPTVRNSAFEETLNTSETSSEKSGETISQDFENNSIDIDARQSAKKPSALKPPVLAAEAASSPNSAAHEATLVVESGDADITLNLGVHGGAAIASTSSSNSLGGVPDTTATANSLHLGLGAADSSIYSVYKAVSPPTAPVAGLGSHNAHTLAHAHAHGHGNFSLEPPALSNKSQGVLEALIETADALDLQNLSNNNESADNPVADLFGIDFTGHESVLGRRSTSEHRVANEWIQERTVDVEPVGAPAQCKGLRDDAAICQSVCFEDSNQLPSPSASHKNADDEHQPQQVDSEESGGEEPGAAPVGDLDEEPNLHASLVGKTSNSSSIVPGKISHASQAIGKLSSQRQSEDADALETLEQPRSEEHLYDASKLTETKTAGLPGSPPVQAHHALSANCWRIASTVLAAGLNATIGEEEFCPLAGKSLNLTYIIPLSRYFKESSFEVQFSSLKPLLWTICNNESNNGEHTKLDPKHPTSQRKGVPLRRERNTSALALNIPNHGYFVRDLELRASDDLTKDLLCQEQASDANTFLQYNIRILRECD